MLHIIPRSERVEGDCVSPRALTTEDFVRRAISIHGERYDYSKTGYVNSNTKVTITCSIHGDFEMLPGNHIHKSRPQDCGKCKGKGLTTDDLITRFRERFGDRFDYSKFEYTGAHEKITIICPDHGERITKVHEHLNSPTGCERCSSERTGQSQRRTQTEVIRAFIARHGDRYDYSKVEYKGSSHNVLIICREHGEFWQRPKAHENGRNCNDCMNKEAGLNRRYTTEQIIARAREVHGDKYDYSKLEYESIENYVIIICSEHGEFVQKMNNHINQGNGCWECGQRESGLNRRVSDEQWIGRFRAVHGQTYDYSEFTSNGAENKAIITCRNHGEFPQEPIVHANGHGCPKCLKKNQTMVYDFLSEIFPDQEIFYDFRHPELRFSQSNATMELDIWIPEISLAVEYQGEQHFETFWKGAVDLTESQTLESTQRRDEEKRKACLSKGITLVEIPYTWDRTLDYVRNAIDESG